MNLWLPTCDIQRFGEPHQSDVIPPSEAVEAFVGDDSTHGVGGVEQGHQRIRYPSVHHPFCGVGDPAGGRIGYQRRDRITPAL